MESGEDGEVGGDTGDTGEGVVVSSGAEIGIGIGLGCGISQTTHKGFISVSKKGGLVHGSSLVPESSLGVMSDETATT